VSVQGPLTLTM